MIVASYKMSCICTIITCFFFHFSTQRSYKHELFNDAIIRTTKACIKTESEIAQFRALQAKVDKILVQKQKAEIDYGDIPDEFRGKQYSFVLTDYHHISIIKLSLCWCGRSGRISQSGLTQDIKMGSCVC